MKAHVALRVRRECHAGQLAAAVYGCDATFFPGLARAPRVRGTTRPSVQSTYRRVLRSPYPEGFRKCSAPRSTLCPARIRRRPPSSLRPPPAQGAPTRVSWPRPPPAGQAHRRRTPRGSSTDTDTRQFVKARRMDSRASRPPSSPFQIRPQGKPDRKERKAAATSGTRQRRVPGGHEPPHAHSIRAEREEAMCRPQMSRFGPPVGGIIVPGARCDACLVATAGAHDVEVSAIVPLRGEDDVTPIG